MKEPFGATAIKKGECEDTKTWGRAKGYQGNVQRCLVSPQVERSSGDERQKPSPTTELGDNPSTSNTSRPLPGDDWAQQESN